MNSRPHRPRAPGTAKADARCRIFSSARPLTRQQQSRRVALRRLLKRYVFAMAARTSSLGAQADLGGCLPSIWSQNTARTWSSSGARGLRRRSCASCVRPGAEPAGRFATCARTCVTKRASARYAAKFVSDLGRFVESSMPPGCSAQPRCRAFQCENSRLFLLRKCRARSRCSRRWTSLGRHSPSWISCAPFPPAPRSSEISERALTRWPTGFSVQ